MFFPADLEILLLKFTKSGFQQNKMGSGHLIVFRNL